MFAHTLPNNAVGFVPVSNLLSNNPIIFAIDGGTKLPSHCHAPYCEERSDQTCSQLLAAARKARKAAAPPPVKPKRESAPKARPDTSAPAGDSAR